MTRVLVVDDSQFMRSVVGNALTRAGYDVDVAADGREAIERVRASDPDVITMDVKMPELDGIEAVERIMRTKPTPILMLSAYTTDGAEATLDALERGAADVLQKPDGSGSQNIGHLTEAVVRKVDDLANADVSSLALARAAAAVHSTGANRAGARRPVAVAGAADAAREDSPEADRSTEPAEPIRLEGDLTTRPTIVLGASTGGPKIVERILAKLPAALEATVFVVQHMPEEFTQRFADRLDSIGEYDVREARDGDTVGPGRAAVAPGGRHLEIAGAGPDGGLAVRLDDGERRHGVRPAIDVTMESAAECVDEGLCGVALTGMGRDGAAGIEAIAGAGGRTIAQDEETSPVFGIPCRAIETGCVDEVVPAESIARAIVDAFTTDGETDE
ncbi:chemotaxis-specific protein-glutamate methyltransferase CheB [Natrialbaceae archaeon GCM10025810]|uniref:chemotaxis-specific protein-glutamate methyltransferase CheB n=1 Tax=Halovalidus salilacus TaxID=3075124 RepID=UPI0036204ED9